VAGVAVSPHDVHTGTRGDVDFHVRWLLPNVNGGGRQLRSCTAL
jgi:hypothetical protein